MRLQFVGAFDEIVRPVRGQHIGLLEKVEKRIVAPLRVGEPLVRWSGSATGLAVPPWKRCSVAAQRSMNCVVAPSAPRSRAWGRTRNIRRHGRAIGPSRRSPRRARLDLAGLARPHVGGERLARMLDGADDVAGERLDVRHRILGGERRRRPPPSRARKWARRARLSARALVRQTLRARAAGRRPAPGQGARRRERVRRPAQAVAEKGLRQPTRAREQRWRAAAAGGSLRRPALAAAWGAKSFPRTCGRRGFVTRWLRRLCFFPLRISRRPGRKGLAPPPRVAPTEGGRPTVRARRASPGRTNCAAFPPAPAATRR